MMESGSGCRDSSRLVNMLIPARISMMGTVIAMSQGPRRVTVFVGKMAYRHNKLEARIERRQSLQTSTKSRPLKPSPSPWLSRKNQSDRQGCKPGTRTSSWLEGRQNEGKGMRVDMGFVTASLSTFQCIECQLPRTHGCYTWLAEDFSRIRCDGTFYWEFSRFTTIRKGKTLALISFCRSQSREM